MTQMTTMTHLLWGRANKPLVSAYLIGAFALYNHRLSA